MRIVMKKGKQKELIEIAKQRFTWDGLSKRLNISEGYLRNELRNEKRNLSKKLYGNLCKITNKNFDKFIIKELNKNWGQIKGGKKSKGATKKIKTPNLSKELAEFFGIMLGDGNSYKNQFYKSRKDKRGVYMIRIVGDSRYDYKYLIKYVKPLIEKLFEIKVKSGFFKPKENFKNSKNAMFLLVHGRELINFLENKGFKPGNKIKNKLEIPLWIKRNDKFLKSCLRGLYDTDGGVYKLNNQNTYQIVFTNFNQKLLKNVRNSLLSLGITPSKITKGNKIYITKKSELRKFLKQIGLRNPRHKIKVERWKLSPIV